jgi:hypothetical protein
MNLYTHLLADSDDDGLYDALKGRVFVSTNPTILTVRAAAEVVARLAAPAVQLSPKITTFDASRPSIYIGTVLPLPLPPFRVPGTFIHITESGLLLQADTDEHLLNGALQLVQWPWLFGQSEIETLLEGAPAVIQVHGNSLTFTLNHSLASAPSWDALPPGLKQIITPTTVFVNPVVSSQAEPELQSKVLAEFILSRSLQGGGLYNGPPEAPNILQTTIGVDRPLLETVAVAARLSTEGLSSKVPITSKMADAGVRLYCDVSVPKDEAEIRTASMSRGTALEIVAHDATTLAQAASYFSEHFPRLPDGTYLDELEAKLQDFFRGTTRLGHLAQLAAHLEQHEDIVRQVYFPFPLSQASRLLGAPVKNTARDGKRTTWRASFRWEGQRFLDAIKALPFSGRHLIIEAFLSETFEVRSQLVQEAQAILQKRGVTAELHLLNAYKPGLHWLLEEISSRCSTLPVANLHISCTKQDPAFGPEDRWLRELYPVAEILEQRHPRLQVAFTVSEEQAETYQVEALDDAGTKLFEQTLTPPTVRAAYLGLPELGNVLTTSGGLRVVDGLDVLHQQEIPTDRDLAWNWFIKDVLPELTEGVEPNSTGPFFAELAINFLASEPDERLPLDHEVSSAIESTHEDFYFGILEAFNHASKLESKNRSLTPGRIVPFCRARTGEDTHIQIIKRDIGTQRSGFTDKRGQDHHVSPVDFALQIDALRLSGDKSPSVNIEITCKSLKAANFLERQLRWFIKHQNNGLNEMILPTDTLLSFEFKIKGATVSRLSIDSEELPAYPREVLPRRPLLNNEVSVLTRNFVADVPGAHLRPPLESLLGNPLISVELCSLRTPAASRARLAAWKPTVLLSARQHANEPTSTTSGFAWLQKVVENPHVLKYVNLVFHPVENPDGAVLHHALCQSAPNHMHHAARYTSCGADLQTNPIISGEMIPESQLRHNTWKRWRPQIHLNNHGYPAHEWIRAQSGYIPQNFEDWSLPAGYLTILIASQEAEDFLSLARERIAGNLSEQHHLLQLTQSQVARNQRYRTTSRLPFTFAGAFPFWESFKNPANSTVTNPDLFPDAPWFTVITEVPDETVSDYLWDWCVEAHCIINEATIDAFIHYSTRIRWHNVNTAATPSGWVFSHSYGIS